MALSRWSHSDWYIYDAGDNEDGKLPVYEAAVIDDGLEDKHRLKLVQGAFLPGKRNRDNIRHRPERVKGRPDEVF